MMFPAVTVFLYDGVYVSQVLLCGVSDSDDICV